MKQSRSTSLIKSLVSTAVGFGVAFLANMIVMPYFGLELSHSANFLLTCIYTVISIARGYALERVFEAMGWRTRMSAFALAMLAERQRQIHVEGYDANHDAQHHSSDLAMAGAAYLGNTKDLWPWDDGFKPDGFGVRRRYVKGAALALAAGELLDRNRKRKGAA